MSDKNFKVKNALALQGTVDTVISADNAGGILVGGSPLVTGTPKGNTASRPASPELGDIYSNTQTGYIEVYTAAGWSQLGVIPLSATIGSPTDVGTNISYGSGSVDVAFTPSAGGGLVSSFTALSTPGSISASASSSPIRVPGLTQGTSYTFTVTATNGYGNALASSSSSSVTPTSLPQAPTINSVTDQGTGGTAEIQFTAGATGGKTISNYKYSTDGTTYTSFSPAQTTSPLIVTGLTDGVSYTFRLKAVNANGDSAASSISSSVLTTAPYILSQTFNSSGTYTVPSGKTKLTAYVSGGGGAGGNAAITRNWGASGGAPGGSSGGAIAFKDYSVTAGQTFTITVGAGGPSAAPNNSLTRGGDGGASSFGNLATANGGTGAVAGESNTQPGPTTVGNYSSNITATGQNGGAGGNSASYNDVNGGTVGTSVGTINLGALGVPTFTPGGGGGGSGGGYYGNTGSGGTGKAGGSTGGGAGGNGGNAVSQNSKNSGNSGVAGSVPGAGGGGAGGGSAPSVNTNGGFSGAGAAGQVLVYVK